MTCHLMVVVCWIEGRFCPCIEYSMHYELWSGGLKLHSGLLRVADIYLVRFRDVFLTVVIINVVILEALSFRPLLSYA